MRNDGNDGGGTLIAEDPIALDAPIQRDDAEVRCDTGDATVLDDLELPVEVRLGSVSRPLEDVLRLRTGDVVECDAAVEREVTLFVQGRAFARGELVIVGERFGFRVHEIFGRKESGR